MPRREGSAARNGAHAPPSRFVPTSQHREDCGLAARLNRLLRLSAEADVVVEIEQVEPGDDVVALGADLPDARR